MDLKHLNWPGVAALNRALPVVVPVAALEQHGGHLPLFTDSLLLGEIVRRAAPALQERALFAPLLWLGNSDHHLDFPGTLSMRPRAYLEVLCGLMEDLARHGFRKIVFLNGHGGNDVPGRQAIFEMRQRWRDRGDLLLLFATYWMLGSPIAGRVAGLSQKQMGHACEWETSMMLRLDARLVGDVHGLGAVPMENPFEPAAKGWITKDRSQPGHIGQPAVASAEKGEALFAAFTADVVDFLAAVAEAP